jgi:EmrB/QacA subfamily drug resistance transporter
MCMTKTADEHLELPPAEPTVDQVAATAERTAAPAVSRAVPQRVGDTRVARDRRWFVLAVVAAAQLMIVLDGSVVNIALPAAQADLGMSDVSRQWVVTAYGLAFGGLLLLGGRLSDLMGRRRALLVGLIGFAAASGAGGLATDTAMLIAARAAQGAFAALLAPSVLALLTLAFPGGRDRATAFGVFSAVAIAGGALGLLLGGVLTEWVSWRWTLLINVVIAAGVALAALPVIPRTSSADRRDRIDVPGALLATLGSVSLVYGFTNAETHGWLAGQTLGLFVAAVILLGAFVALESRVANPLLPLRVVVDRNRGGAYLAVGLAIMAMFGQFLILTYYFQLTLGYTPIQTGLAFLPLTLSLALGSTIVGRRLVPVFPARWVMLSGYLVSAAGFIGLTFLSVNSSFWQVLPGSVLVGLGAGTAGLAANSLSTYGVDPRDAGAASAMLNTSQQIGGAIGTAMLSTVAASVSAGAVASGTVVAAAATMRGYVIAFAIAAGLMVAAAVVSVLFVTAGPDTD